MSLSVWVGTAPISIGHSFILLVYIFGTATILTGHSFVHFSSVWVKAAPISIDHLPIIVLFSLSRDRTYIDWSFICQFQFNLSQGRTYIDRPFSYQFVFSLVETMPILISHFPCRFEFLGLHLYRLIISISTWVLGPHPYQSAIFLSLPCQFEFFRDRTYIDRSSSYYFHVSLSFLGPHLYRLVIFRVNLSFWGHTYINRPYSYHFHVSLSFSGPYLYRLVFFLC